MKLIHEFKFKFLVSKAESLILRNHRFDNEIEGHALVIPSKYMKYSTKIVWQLLNINTFKWEHMSYYKSISIKSK
jgi:hypothetical protein